MTGADIEAGRGIGGRAATLEVKQGRVGAGGSLNGVDGVVLAGNFRLGVDGPLGRALNAVEAEERRTGESERQLAVNVDRRVEFEAVDGRLFFYLVF